jgi:hypothetical protein
MQEVRNYLLGRTKRHLSQAFLKDLLTFACESNSSCIRQQHDFSRFPPEQGRKRERLGTVADALRHLPIE